MVFGQGHEDEGVRRQPDHELSHGRRLYYRCGSHR